MPFPKNKRATDSFIQKTNRESAGQRATYSNNNPEFSDMILVTGATGLVGSRLAFDLVREGHAVRALKRFGRDLSDVQKVFSFYDSANGLRFFEAIEWVAGDVLDTESLKEAFEGIDIVYHAAGLVSYRKKDFDALMAVNQEGTANMVNAALASEVKKFCHISSVAALGKSKSNALIDEQCEWKANECVSNYSLSKFSAEQEVWRGIAEGLDAVIVNPSIILGPAAANQSSGMLMAMVRKGLPYYPSGASGYVDVRDVSGMSIALMQSDIKNEKFLLNSENLTYLELLTKGAVVSQKPKPRFKVSKHLLELAWIFSVIGAAVFKLNPKITRETARSASQKSTYDSGKVQAQLNRKFITVGDALEHYRAYFG